MSRSKRNSRLSLRRLASSARSSVVSPVRPFVRSARACRTQLPSADGVKSNSRATAPTVLPSSNTNLTAPAMNSSENCRRARRPDPVIPFWPSYPPFGRCPPDRINANDRFLRDPLALAASRREDERAEERKREADPVHRWCVGVVTRQRRQHRDRGPKRRDLRERQVDEDDA